MFKNKNIHNDVLHSELEAELIYQAFKPVNMSYHDLVHILKGLPDCSHHIHRYTFPENGYDVDIASLQDVILRRGKKENTELDLLKKQPKNHALLKNKEDAQQIGRMLCEA